MKKKISVLLIVSTMCYMITACGGSFECAFCGDEKTGKKHKMDFWGEEIVICNECKTELEKIGEEMLEYYK